MKTEINLLDFAEKLIKYRKFIIKTVFFITLFSLILSLIWPKTYRSTVRLLTKSQQRSGISSLFSNLLQPMMSTDQLSPEIVLVVLRSRTMSEKVIRKFNLQEIYKTDIPEHLIRKLQANIDIGEIREGGFGFNPLIAIEFSFMNENPKLTKEITEYYVQQLDSILMRLNRERATDLFNIIEKRYLKNLVDLQRSEQNLKDFQEKFGIYEIESQTKSIIERLADLKATIVEIEIQMEILGHTSSADNFQIMQLETQKKAVENKYNELIVSSEKTLQDEPFQPLNVMPELMIQYAQFYRDVTVQNEIYKFVFPQYEQAKLQVEMSTETIQILDQAKLPTYKHKPKRAFIVLAGLLFSIVFSLLLVIIRDTLQSGKSDNDSDYQKIYYIFETLKQDILFWKKNR